ncbi:MAG: hypothetical protein HC848_09400 [Limnobacter sp.]|nr:hypothetical protein [Limnobacter sp.]
MAKTFEELLTALDAKRPTEKTAKGKVYFYKDLPVRFVAGELEGIHWMDIQIELPRFTISSIKGAQKVLEANVEMGMATPIPTWFGATEKGNVVFINRLDWQHITPEILDDHVMRCIDQMSQALAAEGV